VAISKIFGDPRWKSVAGEGGEVWIWEWVRGVGIEIEPGGTDCVGKRGHEAATTLHYRTPVLLCTIVERTSSPSQQLRLGWTKAEFKSRSSSPAPRMPGKSKGIF